MGRFAKSAVYASDTAPVSIEAYKPITPVLVSGIFDKLKSMVAAAKRKALLLVASALEALNIARIRNFLGKIIEARNTIMNEVSKTVAWAKASAQGMAKLVSDVVQDIKNLGQTLSNLVKQSGIYQMANSICSGFDLSGIAAEIASIKVNIDYASAMDYALSGFDKNLFNHLKGCTLFNKESVQKVKDAIDTMLDKSNFVMLDCMKDTTDYWDVHGIDRKLSASAKLMEDSNLNRAALDEIANGS